MQEGINSGSSESMDRNDVILLNFPGIKSIDIESINVKMSTKMRVLALFDKKTISFRRPVERVEDIKELISWLKSEGVTDTNIRDIDGNIIEDFESAIGLDTFTFSVEAYTHIIIFFQKKMYAQPIFI